MQEARSIKQLEVQDVKVIERKDQKDTIKVICF